MNGADGEGPSIAHPTSPAAPLTSARRTVRSTCDHMSARPATVSAPLTWRERPVEAAVGPQHDVGVEHGDERLEVALARRGEEGVDDLPLGGQVGVRDGAAPRTRRRARLAS